MSYSTEIMQAVNSIRARSKPLDLMNRRVLVDNLCFVYQFMVASERLLYEAKMQSTGALREYYVEHYDEERGHEEWLADDLRSAGVDVNSIQRSRTAIAMAGGQYYLMKHVSPAALLGYMLVLECSPMPIEQVKILEDAHGKDLLRTLRYHSVHDIDHGEKLRLVIDGMSDPSIMESAVQTAIYLNEFQQELQ